MQIRFLPVGIAAAAIVACGQTRPKPRLTAPATTQLESLLRQAARRNPEIQAARHDWRGRREDRTLASAWPSPRLQVQSLSVGDPLPGAGLHSSNFAYLGVGASQTIPFPGKLRLRGAIASQGAAVARAQWRRVRRRVLAQVAAAYWQLAYVRRERRLLHAQQNLLARIAAIAAVRYAAGQGTQASVWRAQLEHTRLLRDLAATRNQASVLQAQLRALLAWPPGHPGVRPAPLRLARSPEAAHGTVPRTNPGLRQERARIRGQELALQLARKERDPDFKLSGMYQRTGLRFPAYYMLTLSMNLPFLQRHREKARVTRAVERLHAARAGLLARRERLQYELEQAQADLRTDRDLAQLYRRGLLPQARAAIRASLLDYQSGHRGLAAALAAARRLLQEQLAYARVLEQHASAGVRIRQITRGY